MTARDEILARVRAALTDRPVAPPVPRDYRRRGATDDRPALTAQLAERLIDYRAQVHRTAPPGLAATIADVLCGTTTLVTPADLAGDWLTGYSGAVRRDHDRDPIPVADLDAPGVRVLTGCAVAIAGTGTLVLDAGPGQSRRTLTLVPDHHLCVVHTGQIVATVPEGIALLDPTRPLTFISGPSATSDIELNRVEGVHGPRHLDVILVG